jgi:hypothetical protein
MSEIASELTCFPLDNTSYTCAALGAAFAVRGRGVVTAASFAATPNGDNTLTIGEGCACLKMNQFWGCFPLLTSPVTLSFAAADAAFARYDAVALLLDKNANKAGLAVRTGVAGAAPVPPVPRRTDAVDEILLYRVYRPAGALKITADQLTDQRLDAACCGLMRDTVDAADTSAVSAQFSALLEKIQTELANLNAGTETMVKTAYDADNDGVVDLARKAEQADSAAFAARVNLNAVYPVGSIYLSVAAADPATLFGGVWEALCGRFLVGAGPSAANNSTYWGSTAAGEVNCPAGEMSGESRHTLNLSEIPSHNHALRLKSLADPGLTYNELRTGTNGGGDWALTATEYAGGSGAHNNMPPYLSIYMWKRTA